MHRLVCILWCAAAVLAAGTPLEKSSNKPFDPESFSSDFSALTESFKAKAISAVSDEVASYMDEIGVTALLNGIVDSNLGQYLNQSAVALDDMVDYFADSSVKDRLEGAVNKVTGKLVTNLKELAGLVSPSKSSGNTAAADKRTATAQAGSIGDVVVATVGLGISPSVKTATYKGQDFSASWSAGFHFQVGMDIATMSDAVVALGGGASVGFTAGELPDVTKADPAAGNEAARQKATLSRMASVLSGEEEGAEESGLLSKLDDDLEATIGLDFFASAEDLTGFAYKVSVTLPEFSHIKELHVYLSHPQWGCLSVNPSAMYAPVVSGWGITLYSGKPSGMLAAAPGLWSSLDAASTEMADLKGKWDSKWGAGALMVGDTMTIASTGSLDLSRSACTAKKTVTDAGSDPSADVIKKITSVSNDVANKVADVVSFIETSKALILDASFTVPFCVGECSATPYSDESSLSGSATLKFTADHNGGEVDLYVDGITFGGLTTVIAEPLPHAAKEVLIDMMQPLAGLGLGKSSVIVTVTSEGVSVTAAGSPSFPASSGTSAFEAVLRTISDAVVELKASMTYSGAASLELDVGTPPSTSKGTLAVVSEDGKEGFALFAKAADVGELDVGVSLPLRICVGSCSSVSPQYLHLKGTLALELSGEEQNVEGELVMDGWWNKAFDVPFVNIADIILGLAMNLETFLPSKLDLGGAVCLGKSQDCEASTGTYVKGRAYVGLDLAAPENSYYIMMISKLTVGTIFDLIGEYSSFVKDLDIDGKFPALAESGIYPYDADAQCTGQSGTGAPHTFDKSCYAYMSFNGAGEDKTLTFKDGELVIPNGVAFSGKIDFFGWNFGVQAHVTETKFDMAATMDKVDFAIGGVKIMEIGKAPSATSPSEVSGGAYFHVVADSGAILLNIEGAFAIPVLRSYGYMNIELNSKIFSFTSDMHLFDGALTSKTSVQWNWDLTYFKAQMEDISFGGVVVVKDVHFEYNSAASSIDLGVSISVLSIVSVAADLQIKGDQIAFDVSADLALVTISVSGTAEIATPFHDSHFTLHVSVSAGGVAKAIFDAGKKACEAVAATATKAWDGLYNGMSAEASAIKHLFSSALSSMAHEAEELMHDISKFFSDVMGALNSIPLLGSVFGALGDFAGGISNVANSLFGTTSSSHIVTTSDRNEYGCYYKYQSTHVCHHYLFYSSCHYDNGKWFPDRLCMIRVAIAAQQVKIHGLKGQILQVQLAGSKAVNKGLSDFVSGASLQYPEVQNFSSTYPMDKPMPTVAAKVRVSQLTSNGIEHGVEMTKDILINPSTEASLAASHNSATEYLAKEAASFTVNGQNPTRNGVSHSELLSLQNQLTAAAVKLSQYMFDEVKVESEERHAEALVRDADVLAGNDGDDDNTTTTNSTGSGYFPEFSRPILQHTKHRESVSPCVDVTAVLEKQQPHFRHVDKHCKKGTTVHLRSVEALSDFDTCEHVSKHKVEWVGVDGCGGVSEPVYTVVFRSHGMPSFVSVPDYYIVGRLGDESGPRTTGSAGGMGECGANVTMTYEDSEPHMVSGSFWKVVRTWTTALDVPAHCTRAQSRPVSKEQTILFGNSDRNVEDLSWAGVEADVAAATGEGVSRVRIASRHGGYVGMSADGDSVVRTDGRGVDSVWCLTPTRAAGMFKMSATGAGCLLGTDGGAVVCEAKGAGYAGADVLFATGAAKQVGAVKQHFLNVQLHRGLCLAVDPFRNSGAFTAACTGAGSGNDFYIETLQSGLKHC